MIINIILLCLTDQLMFGCKLVDKLEWSWCFRVFDLWFWFLDFNMIVWIVCFTAFSVYYLPFFFLFWILFYFLLVCCLNRVYRSLKAVKFIFIHLRILGGGNLLCLHSYGDSYMNLLCIADIFPHFSLF